MEVYKVYQYTYKHRRRSTRYIRPRPSEAAVHQLRTRVVSIPVEVQVEVKVYKAEVEVYKAEVYKVYQYHYATVEALFITCAHE